MKTRVITLSLLAGIVAVCFPMFAHHGNAAYDMKEVMLKDASTDRRRNHCIHTPKQDW